MSLWTPSGEHPIGDDRGTQGAGEALGDPRPAPGGGGDPEGPVPGIDPEVDQLRDQLADAPADVVIANHCYGLFELAAVYLSAAPPRLEQARLAIDGLGALVEGLGERLGEPHQSLRDALAQIRLAFVQISAAHEHAGNGTPQAPAQPPGVAGGAGASGD